MPDLDSVLNNATSDETEIDFSEAVTFEALPKDRYRCVIEEIKPGTSKEGNPKLVWKLAVKGGPFDKRVLFAHLPTSGKGSGRLKSHLKALGVDVNSERITFKRAQFVGKEVDVDVDVQKDNDEFNEIKRILPVSASAALGL